MVGLEVGVVCGSHRGLEGTQILKPGNQVLSGHQAWVSADDRREQG